MIGVAAVFVVPSRESSIHAGPADLIKSFGLFIAVYSSGSLLIIPPRPNFVEAPREDLKQLKEADFEREWWEIFFETNDRFALRSEHQWRKMMNNCVNVWDAKNLHEHVMLHGFTNLHDKDVS